jgi:hypothetical protein
MVKREKKRRKNVPLKVGIFSTQHSQWKPNKIFFLNGDMNYLQWHPNGELIFFHFKMHFIDFHYLALQL